MKSILTRLKERQLSNLESLHVDQIYRTRENRAWCKERGIRISGPPLGRPKKSISLAEKKQAQLDARIRNEKGVLSSFLSVFTKTRLVYY